MLSSLAFRHQGLVEALHDDAQAEYESAVQDAERRTARQTFLNDKRREYWRSHPAERQGEPPLSDAELAKDAAVPPVSIAGWTVAYALLALAAALWGLVVVFRTPGKAR